MGHVVARQRSVCGSKSSAPVVANPVSVEPPRPALSSSTHRQTAGRSEEHTSELQSLAYLVCRLLLEKKKRTNIDSLASAATTKSQTYRLNRYDISSRSCIHN